MAYVRVCVRVFCACKRAKMRIEQNTASMQMKLFSKERELVNYSEQVAKQCSYIGFYLEESSCTVSVE